MQHFKALGGAFPDDAHAVDDRINSCKMGQPVCRGLHLAKIDSLATGYGRHRVTIGAKRRHDIAANKAAGTG